MNLPIGADPKYPKDVWVAVCVCEMDRCFQIEMNNTTLRIASSRTSGNAHHEVGQAC